MKGLCAWLLVMLHKDVQALQPKVVTSKGEGTGLSVPKRTLLAALTSNSGSSGYRSKRQLKHGVTRGHNAGKRARKQVSKQAGKQAGKPAHHALALT